MYQLAPFIALTLMMITQSASAATTCPAALESQRTLFGETINLCEKIAAAKAVLVVNTASKCGYTPQFEQLQTLHEAKADQGLLIIGIPTADFGGQEFNNEKETAEFCRVNYGVAFTMLPKSCTRCASPQPLFEWMHQLGGAQASWNFYKHLYSPANGRVKSFPSRVSPTGPALTHAIDGLVAEN